MLLTVKDVAQKLNVSPSCVYQLVETKSIPHHRIGVGRGSIRFTEDDITQYLDGNRENHGANGRPSLPSRHQLKHLKL